MSSPFKTKEFYALKSIWDKKLKESGFEDVESQDREPILNAWHSHHFFSQYTPDEFLNKQQYYIWALHFLETHSFKSKTDRQIWELHAKGCGVRQIAEYLTTRGIPILKDEASHVIRRLKAFMKEVPKEEKCEKRTSSQLDLWTLLTMDLSSQHG